MSMDCDVRRGRMWHNEMACRLPGISLRLAVIGENSGRTPRFIAIGDVAHRDSLTPQPYWSFSTVGQELRIHARSFLPVRLSSIPTGEIRQVEGTRSTSGRQRARTVTSMPTTSGFVSDMATAAPSASTTITNETARPVALSMM